MITTPIIIIMMKQDAWEEREKRWQRCVPSVRFWFHTCAIPRRNIQNTKQNTGQHTPHLFLPLSHASDPSSSLTPPNNTGWDSVLQPSVMANHICGIFLQRTHSEGQIWERNGNLHFQKIFFIWSIGSKASPNTLLLKIYYFCIIPLLFLT